MIPRECKRLAEVDFPIAVVSKHAAREKSIRHGHPSTLHLWWARRPLASCRAMLLALLLPDPCDEHCPEEFKAEARAVLDPLPGQVGNTDDELREALLRLIGEVASWDLATSSRPFLEAARGLVKAGYPNETPVVVDPFAGGGSIALEALRLGCDVFASDLNPVACLILKTVLEDIPRQGPGFADELHRLGMEITGAVEKELADFYPVDPDGAKPIAYLWARTVRCEGAHCGAEIPLVRSFWLSKKAARRKALRYVIERPNTVPPIVTFEIFTPQSDTEVPRGTVARAKATCPCCGATMAPDRVRTQLAIQRGGADTIFSSAAERVGGARLLAVATLKTGEQGRQYRLPMDRDFEAVRRAHIAISKLKNIKIAEGLTAIPNEPLPPIGTLGFRVQRYGMTEWGDLFTARQKLALHTVASLISERAPAIPTVALALGKLADLANTICRWEPVAECPRNVFAAGRVKMGWDFAEGSIISASSGSFSVCVDNLIEGIISVGQLESTGSYQIAKAQNSLMNESSADVWFTDPPYDDQIPYADLSDVFFVWLKRALPGHPLMCDPFDSSNPLTPKAAEAVRDETKIVDGRRKDRAFFEDAMSRAFAAGDRITREDGIGCVIFAHKTTEGWEALLSGMTRGGWTIRGSWPIATETAHRLRARDSAALATSVHLICRRRSKDEIGDWADVLRELPDRVGVWMARLEREGVRGADLVFACIGPALEIFSRYSRVETPDGREVLLAEYLEKVWEVVGRAALHQILGTAEAQARNSGAGALEEDARLTALFLWTIRSTAGNGAGETAADGENEEEADETDEEEDGGNRKPKGYTLIYDIARRFAQPLGIHLDDWKDRIIDIDKGVVRLLPIRDRARQLFGEAGAAGLADRIERAPDTARQLELFPGLRDVATEQQRGRRRRFGAASAHAVVTEATTLDRVHTAMLLQSSGRTNALRALLAAEQERGPDFVRLSNALSALYPQGSEEKRLLDAMLLALPR
jgi:adenine-specific DNA methylase